MDFKVTLNTFQYNVYNMDILDPRCLYFADTSDSISIALYFFSDLKLILICHLPIRCKFVTPCEEACLYGRVASICDRFIS